MWFSLPYTKWHQWSKINYNSEEKQVKLQAARRRERRLLWFVNQFMKEALVEDSEMDFFFEWPHRCDGWQQQPMVDLENFMKEHGVPWLRCRIDGCIYGMKDPHGLQLGSETMDRHDNGRELPSHLSCKSVHWQPWCTLQC